MGGNTEYIRAAGMTLARVVGASVTWLHHDHLGSAVAGTNSAGAVIWRESEQPFGEDWISAPANDNQAGYTGHVEDAATGLVYMQARYYDPVIGRFLSIDPVGFSTGRPDMFNRYAYAVNDPINMWDPFGECSYDDDGKAKSGICPDPNDSKAAEIVDTQLNDENSIASEIEGQLNEAGMIVFVSTREDIATTDSAATPPDPTLLGSPQANGSITIGLQPGSVTGTTTGSQVEGAIDLTVAEAFEHELSHVQDGLDGRANDNGPGIITASGAVVNVYRGGVNEGREEARAVNRTNLYRQKSGLGKQRTRY